MQRFLTIFIAHCALTAMAGLLKADPNRKATSSVDFSRDIRPLLSDRCFACHGPDEEHREADLRTDDYESMLEDRGGYQVIQPGAADQSELFRRIGSSDPDEVMPPPGAGKPLDEREKQLLRDWINQGADWKQHWAYVTPSTKALPEPAVQPGWQANNLIDSYILARLEPVGGKLSPEADRVTLARRLSLDLTGLPPSSDAIQAITNDRLSISSYTEQLLASHSFGERLASYWLDLVRFADTVGYHGDQDHNVSPYRDYVIHAFNDNKPFDAFTVEQLSGDLLNDPSDEQLAATAYNRLLQTSHEGGVQPKEYLAIYAADRVRNVSAVWLGATLGCAQCHDHKYDPFTAHDFYSFAAFFADIDEAQHFKVGSNALPTRRPPEKPFLSRAELLLLDRYRDALSEAQAELSALPASAQPCDELADEDSAGRDRLTKRIEELQRKIDVTESQARQCMVTQSISPREIRFLPRGNWLDDSGQIMQPDVPAFLGKLIPADGSPPTRLDLARWLTDEVKGIGLLTARVWVNRVWMLLFGDGISRSVDDFGGQGEPPTHPELLDRLALEFVRSGWDTKRLVHTITDSRTYRQSSLQRSWHQEHDPGNRLLARQNRFRQPAESIRDIALQVSGLLVTDVGGASVKPYQPAGYYRHLNFPTRKYTASTGADQWRRGLYTHWQRQFLHPMLRAFDAPTREECTAERAASNTPIAALTWLNDPTFVKAAEALAGLRDRPSGGASFAPQDTPSQIANLFALATNRRPETAELELLRKLLAATRQAYATDEEDSATAEQVAWTTVARAILNLNEVYTRN